MTWEKAKKFCTDLQAEMVVLESEEEIKEVAKMTADLIKKKWRFWVDGKMINKAWKTHKGEKTPSFTPWGKVSNSVVGDCIRTGDDTKWYKAPCEAKDVSGGYTINPFCKKPLEKSSKASLTKGRGIFTTYYLGQVSFCPVEVSKSLSKYFSWRTLEVHNCEFMEIH